MFDPQAWANHLTSEQIVRLAEALPSLMTAGAALSASITSLVVAIKARQAASEAQRTAEDATDQAREAAKEQIRFALKDVARHFDSERIDHFDSERINSADPQGGTCCSAESRGEQPSLFTPEMPPKEGGSHD